MRHAPSFLLVFSSCVESYMFQGGGWTWMPPRKKSTPAGRTQQLPEWSHGTPTREQESQFVIQARGFDRSWWTPRWLHDNFYPCKVLSSDIQDARRIKSLTLLLHWIFLLSNSETRGVCASETQPIFFLSKPWVSHERAPNSNCPRQVGIAHPAMYRHYLAFAPRTLFDSKGAEHPRIFSLNIDSAERWTLPKIG